MEEGHHYTWDEWRKIGGPPDLFTKSRYEDCTVCAGNIYCEDHKKMAKDLRIAITPLDIEIYY